LSSYSRGRAAIVHYRSSPFATERLSYLSHLMEEGHSRSRLRSVAHLLLSIAQHLPLDRAEIAPVEIEASAEAWAGTTHRSAICLHSGKREFVFHATKWLQLLGQLHEPQRQQPFALEMDAFLRYAQQERGLASSTLDHYRRHLEEFLVRLDQRNMTFRDVTPDDISEHIQIVAQRKLKRTSMQPSMHLVSNGWRVCRVVRRGATFNGCLQPVQATRPARFGIIRCCWSSPS
jgi:integrase/recombinase XerD